MGADGHLPYLHQVVRVASKRGLATRRPGPRSVLGWLRLAAGMDNFLFQFIYNKLALQVSAPELGPVAAQSQLWLGLTHRVLMMSSPSSTSRCLPLLGFHSMAGSPAFQKHRGIHLERRSQWSGDPWLLWLVVSLQWVRFHTLCSLAQPQERMMGLLLLGEKQTEDTHSEWLSSWSVYLHTPRGYNRNV